MSDKELFVKAFLEAEKIEYAPFLDVSVEWDVSKDFERKMNAVINKNNRIKPYRRLNCCFDCFCRHNERFGNPCSFC